MLECWSVGGKAGGLESEARKEAFATWARRDGMRDGYETNKSEHGDAMMTTAHKQFREPEPSELLRSVLAINSSQFCNTVAAGGD